MDQTMAEENPSTYAGDWFIWSECEVGQPPDSTENCGKWMIFRNTGAPINEAWKIVSEATKNGRLGEMSKVSTILHHMHNTRASKDKDGNYKHVICVYTYDYTDEKDVFRVRQELRDLGFTEKLPYKSDKATLAGKYSYNTNQRVSMWWSH